jgi:O-antigen ligase
MNFLYRSYRRSNIDSMELVFFVLLLLASFTMTQVIYPYAYLIVLLCLAISFIVFLKPMIGIYILILLYPLGSVYLIARLPQAKIIYVQFEEIFSFMLLLVMILRQLSERHQRPMHDENFKAFPHKWIFFLLALFIFWSIFITYRAEYFIISLIGLWRFVTSFIIIAFLVLYLDSYDKFISVSIFYCCVSAIYALSAVYATNFAFQVNYELFQIFDTFISFQISLFNEITQFSSTTLGMRMGVGLATKHDLAMLLTGGIFFALFLMKLYDSLKVRCVLLTLILLFMTIIYQVFSRISITGMFLVAVFLCLAIPSWRKSTVWVVVILIVMNLAGLFCFSLIKTTHLKNQESTMQQVESVTSESEFASSSLSGRKLIWKKTIERILRNKGLGSGPDSLMTDITFAVPTAHNLFLTLTAEYGFPGAVLILLFLLVIADSAYKSAFIGSKVKNNLWLLQAVFVAASLHALFVYCFDVPINKKQLWFMLGLLMASINVAEKEKTRDNNLPPTLSLVV